MRRSIWTRVLVALLVISMVATPVSAAGWGNISSRSWGSFWDRWFGGGNKVVVTEPTEPEEDEPVLTLVEDASTVDNGAGLRASTYTLTSEEDSVGTNAVNAYSLMATADEADTKATTTVKYFPVTMYNYEGYVINGATDALDDDLTVRDGLYFSNGGDEMSYERSSMTINTVEYTVEDGNVVIPDGTYLLYCTNTSFYVNGNVNTSSPWGTTALNGTTANNHASATLWTFTRQDDGSYAIQNAAGSYMTITGSNSANLTSDFNTITLDVSSADDFTVKLYDDAGGNNGYLNSLGGTWYGVGYFGGYSSGSNFTLRTITEGDNKIVSGYQEWNFWNKATGDNGNGDLIYTGLVQSQLVDDQIVFNVPEGGIFNNDATVKSIYEYVGLPFVLDSETGVYSFYSNLHTAYFPDTDGDGDSDPQSGSIDASGNISAYNLHYDVNTQGWSGMNYGDGSKNLWAPFNTNENDNSEAAIDYHFGMRADLPFSMTPNGRIKSTDDESTPIKFTFSGDDDVWVFIDGHLVIDLGGIHNRLDATINFAENTITYSEANAQDGDNSTASYNDPNFKMTQQLFTTEAGVGVINQSRDAFALDPDHEMQVFYLERGKGASNCRIEFNLPMNDTVLVTKDATRSWNSTSNKEEDLTDPEEAVINEMDFGFTLYKKEAGATAFTAVKNTNFYLVGRAVEGTVINSTDANGHFYLKNGQSAKFITEIPTEGVTYYVVEDKVPNGFVSPDFTYAGEATYDYSYTGITASDDDTETTQTVTGTAPAADATQIRKQVIPMPKADEDGNLIWEENKSYEVTVKGSIEANDSIEFICSNYMDATLPNPSVFAMEDIIVLDYGLSVKIDPLVNDLYRGDTMEILYVGGADVTLTTETDSDGRVNGDWTEDDTLDFGSVELVKGTAATTDNSRDTFIYTLSKQLTEVEVLTYIVKTTGTAENAAGDMKENNAFSIGKVYIVPATVMYYEENFSGLVKFTGSNWVGPVDTAGKSDYQEPGVVGTTTDSIYGTDVAYLDDRYDSNGTSYYGDTSGVQTPLEDGTVKAGAIQFSYTFTGTGTSIFARTSDTTGYVQFKLYEGTDTSGTAKHITYRDTYWKDENTTDLDEDGTLYNIPIYTEEDLKYGTYTVVATVAKAGTKTAGNDNGSGKDFWLDGIRIMQPLNEGNDTVIDEEGTTITEKALGAYATDGESNIDTVTLRNKLITDDDTGDNAWNFAVLTDITGEVVLAEDYESIGPKEEVYLLPGQSVSFAVKYWHTDGYRMHMGMKAPFGNASVKVGQNTYDLKNTVDCYFDITGSQSSVVTKYEPALNEAGFPIYKDAEDNEYYKDAEGNFYTAEGNDVEEEIELTPVYDETAPYFFATYTFTATDSIVSLTNIKIVGNYEFSLVDNVDRKVDGDSGES